MFVDITKVAIDNNSLSPQEARTSAHQTTPARRVVTFRLRDEDDAILPGTIDEVRHRFGRRFVIGIYHLDCVRRTAYFGLASAMAWREHLQAVQIPTVRDIELDQSIANLDTWLVLSCVSMSCDLMLTSQVVKRFNA